MSSAYRQLPTKFDYTQYYLNQAGGGPSFPVFRARQRGGSFLAPFIRRHGIPFLKWIGRQAASLASGAGSAYLNKGSLSKEEMKDLLKKQGKEAANSVLDKMKQQVGSGTMTHRRDTRLSSLLPAGVNGILSNQHWIRSPVVGGESSIFNGIPSRRRKSARSKKASSRGSGGKRQGLGSLTQRKKKKKKLHKKPARKAATAKHRKSKALGSKSSRKKKKSSAKNKRSASDSNNDSFNHTIFS